MEEVTGVETKRGHKRKKRYQRGKSGGRLSETGIQVNPDLEKDLVGCFVDKFSGIRMVDWDYHRVFRSIL